MPSVTLTNHMIENPGSTNAMRQLLLGHSKEVDWAIGGAAFGFTAGLLQFLSNTAFKIGEQNRRIAERKESVEKFDYIDRKTSFQQKMSFKRKQFEEDYRNEPLEYEYEDTDDVYDYEDYVLNQLEAQTTLPETFHRFKFSKTQQNVPTEQKTLEDKIMDYTSQNFGPHEEVYHPNMNAYVGIEN